MKICRKYDKEVIKHAIQNCWSFVRLAFWENGKPGNELHKNDNYRRIQCRYFHYNFYSCGSSESILMFNRCIVKVNTINHYLNLNQRTAAKDTEQIVQEVKMIKTWSFCYYFLLRYFVSLSLRWNNPATMENSIEFDVFRFTRSQVVYVFVSLEKITRRGLSFTNWELSFWQCLQQGMMTLYEVST